jgi:hypothetical protein
MNKVLIISDNHGSLDRLQRVIETTGPYDLVLHCGDGQLPLEVYEPITGCPVRMVKGNCDSYALPVTELFDWKGYRIFMTHGHKQYVKFGLDDLIAEAKRQDADIVLFGHTHIPYMEMHEGVLFANPGSLTYPNFSEPSYAVMTLSEKQPKIDICFFAE